MLITSYETDTFNNNFNEKKCFQVCILNPCSHFSCSVFTVSFDNFELTTYFKMIFNKSSSLIKIAV